MSEGVGRLCRCGSSALDHYRAIIKIIEDPFGPTTTEYILLCPQATFYPATAEEPDKPVKAKKRANSAGGK